MRKIKNLSLLLLLLFVVLVSCTNETSDPISKNGQIENASVIVENGRLKFKDKEHLLKTINEINKFSEADFKAWEKSLPGFSSMRSNATIINDNSEEDFYLPLSLKSILNKKGQYKVGNDIVYIEGEDQYIIANSNETLLNKVINKDNGINSKMTSGIVYQKIKTKIIEPTNIKPNDGAKVLLGNNDFYEYRFDYLGSHPYRFKYLSRVYIDRYFINVEVFSFFEYLKQRSGRSSIWSHAGEQTQKTLENLRIYGSASYPGGPFDIFYPTYSQYSNQDIHVAEAFATDQLFITISGKFTSSVDLPQNGPILESYSFTQDCVWENINVSKL